MFVKCYMIVTTISDTLVRIVDTLYKNVS